jgi:hypothetical protein
VTIDLVIEMTSTITCKVIASRSEHRNMTRMIATRWQQGWLMRVVAALVEAASIG